MKFLAAKTKREKVVHEFSGRKENTRQFLKEAKHFLTLKSKEAISWVGFSIRDTECY